MKLFKRQPREDRKKLTGKQKLAKIWDDRVGYLMSAPYVILFTIFTVLPVAVSMFFSFTDFNMLQWPNFVGLENYSRLLLHDEIFLIAIRNTVILAGITGPVGYLLCFFFAWCINEFSPKVRAFITLCFLLKLGVIDSPILWFTNTQYMMPLCIVVILWTSLGTSFLAFIAGFQGVDRTYYEAAAVDGVRNRWQELWYITLPSMKSMLMFGAVQAITGAFGFGAIVDALCGNPSVDYCAWTLTHHLNEYMTTRFEFGYASAISLVLFLLCFGSNIAVQKFLSKVGQ